MPPPRIPKRDEELLSVSISTAATQSGEFPNQESNIDEIYVNNNHKVKMVTNEPKSDLLILENGTKQIVKGKQDVPPPLPIKKKYKQNIVLEEEIQYRITDGVYAIKKVMSLIYLYKFPSFKILFNSSISQRNQ